MVNKPSTNIWRYEQVYCFLNPLKPFEIKRKAKFASEKKTKSFSRQHHYSADIYFHTADSHFQKQIARLARPPCSSAVWEQRASAASLCSSLLPWIFCSCLPVVLQMQLIGTAAHFGFLEWAASGYWRQLTTGSLTQEQRSEGSQFPK